MKVNFLHLFPSELSLNGETGNLKVLTSRLNWAGIESATHPVGPGESLPKAVDAVFVGSGSMAGMLSVIKGLPTQTGELVALSKEGVPFFAVGYGWEILGEEIALQSGEQVRGAGVFPSRSIHNSNRVSEECFGFDEFGNLSTGYANHSGEMILNSEVPALLKLVSGYGNSSISSAPDDPDEGIVAGSLMATRLNGPVLAMNPHLADRFLSMVANNLGLDYESDNEFAQRADSYASHVREELRARLAR